VCAIVAERPVDVPDGFPLAIVANSRLALAAMAAAFYGYPSRRLKLFGVTGTNGKTTTAYLIESILRESCDPTGVIGTLGTRIGDEIIETERTTPESLDLQSILATMVGRGVRAVAMEVSSHGLALHRTEFCEFDCGVFTNLTQDHLDFHPDLEDYLAAKMRLFTDYPATSRKGFTAAINADDPYGARIAAACKGRVFTYGVESQADVVARNVRITASSCEFWLDSEMGSGGIFVPLGGMFNLHNALAAAAAALSQGISIGEIILGIGNAQSVPGRFESVDCGQDFGVIVDYAHTPDGLENVLRSARKLTRGKLIAVFGCGGDRDRGKRPIMGAIGSREADLCVVTSDNPRTEDPDAIVREIVAGIENPSRARIVVEPDRRRAIEEAVSMAGEGDVVVIAGKGHETEQVFADRTIPFDDRVVVREALKERMRA